MDLSDTLEHCTQTLVYVRLANSEICNGYAERPVPWLQQPDTSATMECFPKVEMK